MVSRYRTSPAAYRRCPAKIDQQEFNKQQQIKWKTMSKEKPRSFAEAVSKS
jgi:hypothetical protein